MADLTLQGRLAGLLGQSHDCQAVGYVDIASGRLLCGHATTPQGRQALMQLAAAMAALLGGVALPGGPARGQEGRAGRGLSQDVIEDVVVHRGAQTQVVVRGRAYPDCAAIFVCRSTADPSAVLSKARLAMPLIESAV